MGTPNRLSVIFGEAQIGLSELTEEELSLWVQRIISEIKPHLKYLDSCYTTLETVLSGWRNSDGERIYKSDDIFWFTDIAHLKNAKYKVLSLSQTTTSPKPIYKFGHSTKEDIRELHVFMDRYAELFFVEISLEFTRTPRRRDHDFCSQKVLFAQIYRADPEKFIAEIRRNIQVGRDFIYWLDHGFQDAVRKREERLSGMKGTRDFLSGIAARIL